MLVIYLSSPAAASAKRGAGVMHPVKLSFFPTISISLLLIATALQGMNSSFVLPIWATGAVLHLLFTLYVGE